MTLIVMGIACLGSIMAATAYAAGDVEEESGLLFVEQPPSTDSSTSVNFFSSSSSQLPAGGTTSSQSTTCTQGSCCDVVMYPSNSTGQLIGGKGPVVTCGRQAACLGVYLAGSTCKVQAEAGTSKVYTYCEVCIFWSNASGACSKSLSDTISHVCSGNYKKELSI